MKEGVSSEWYAQKAIEFSSGDCEAQVYRLPLQFPDRDTDGETVEIGAYLALFNGEDDEDTLVIRQYGDDDLAMFQLKIALLELPKLNPGLKLLGACDNEELEQENLEATATAELPYLVLIMGRQSDTGEDFIAMYAITGISPKKALRRIKTATVTHFTNTDRQVAGLTD